MSGITLQEVTKVYSNGVRAVDAVDLEIADGEFVVLVGPSGCGKSTLLRMIAGLEDVTDGGILIGGDDVTDKPPQKRDIAMVFQNYALYPHMTVRENLAYGLRLRKLPKAEWQRRVHETAKTLGLDELLDRKPSALSGGQRQRVAMGRAIVREPQAFLMDEPLSNLDAKLRVSMRAELARLHERLGVTTVYVTHDQVEAMTLGQRVAVLRDGVLQQVDTPQNLFHRPVNLFVAAFIGSTHAWRAAASRSPTTRSSCRPTPRLRATAASTSSGSGRPTSSIPPRPMRRCRACGSGPTSSRTSAPSTT
jgi:multiple sugar transport system ATP-binding protein